MSMSAEPLKPKPSKAADEKVKPEGDWFPERNADKTWYERFKAYSLIMWDGTGFFGLSTAKLGRLEGTPVGWFTKCMDMDWLVVNATGFLIILIVLIQEVGKYGTQKSQTINMNIIVNQTYNFRDAIPIIGGHWFFINELVPKINGF